MRDTDQSIGKIRAQAKRRSPTASYRVYHSSAEAKPSLEQNDGRHWSFQQRAQKRKVRIGCPRRTALRTLTKLGHTAPAMDRLLLVDAVQLPL